MSKTASLMGNSGIFGRRVYLLEHLQWVVCQPASNETQLQAEIRRGRQHRLEFVFLVQTTKMSTASNEMKGAPTFTVSTGMSDGERGGDEND